MTRYSAFLEIADDGRCLAHVLDLPGLVVRAATREETLRELPEAIGEYHAWLRRHGETAPPEDGPVEIEVVEESVGFGPFERRNAAALFAPDREPVTLEEMERTFQLMDRSRADLLALVSNLSDDLLDWQPHPEAFSIRGLLRHVGNAEEWYVSRLVPPETLPPEWEDDEGLPIFEFLEMERRTAIERLKQLSEEERSAVFYPTGWTDHPQEPWTARKALRRFLEHEREHTWQVREILDARRCSLFANLAARRADLLEQIIGLDEQTLISAPVVDSWTIKDLLTHIAAWDRWEDRTMRCMAAGEEPDLTPLENFEQTNAVFVAQGHNRTLEEVLIELQAARADWVTWLASLPEEEFFRPRSYGGDDWSFHTDPLPIQWQHDAGHTEQIAAWRQRERVRRSIGPKAVLLAALGAARGELRAAAALIPPQERTTKPAHGEWTLKDILGHIADWEWIGVQGLRHMAAGQAPQVERVDDIETWNQEHVAARRSQPWEVVWDDLQKTRQALLDALEGMHDYAMDRVFPFSWGGEGTPYRWARVFFDHDREHAADLRSGRTEET